HLDVEKDQVRRLAAYRLDRRHAITALGQQFDVGIVAQQARDGMTRDRFVVHDQGGDAHVDATSGASSDSSISRNGRRSRQTTPSGQIMSRRTCATSPYSSRKRSSVFDRPIPCPDADATPTSRVLLRLRTSMHSVSPSRRLSISMQSTPIRLLIPWVMAFSTIGCRIRLGTAQSSVSGAMYICVVRRSLKRMRWMPR